MHQMCKGTHEAPRDNAQTSNNEAFTQNLPFTKQHIPSKRRKKQASGKGKTQKQKAQ
jgi:hypothetical protein